MLLSLLNEALSNNKTMNFLFAVWSQFFPFVCLSCALSVGSTVGKRGASDGNSSVTTSWHGYLEVKLKKGMRAWWGRAHPVPHYSYSACSPAVTVWFGLLFWQ